MTTAQDIKEKTFERAGRGYDMGQVDDFLDQLAADLSALEKENAQLRQKMRVLVEKVEEYRQTEDSMRLALLSAQKMSSQIEGEARERADAIVAEARESADRITRRSTEGIANEEAKLEEAKKATRKFFEHMRAVCEKQIEFYAKLSQMRLVGGDGYDDQPADMAAVPAQTTVPAEEPAAEPAAEEVARSIGENVSTMDLPEDPTPVDIAPAAEAPQGDEEPTRRFEEPTRRFEDTTARRKKSFDDFRFDDEL